MALLRSYVWQDGDRLRAVAASILAQTAFPDLPTLVEAIYAANPLIADWLTVPANSVILLPYN